MCIYLQLINNNSTAACGCIWELTNAVNYTDKNFQAKRRLLKLHIEFECQILLVVFKISSGLPVNVLIMYKMKFFVILDPQRVVPLTAVGWISHVHLLYHYSYTHTHLYIQICVFSPINNGTAFCSTECIEVYIMGICFTDVFHNSFKRHPYWHQNTKGLNQFVWKMRSLCYEDRHGSNAMKWE